MLTVPCVPCGACRLTVWPAFTSNCEKELTPWFWLIVWVVTLVVVPPVTTLVAVCPSATTCARSSSGCQDINANSETPNVRSRPVRRSAPLRRPDPLEKDKGNYPGKN